MARRNSSVFNRFAAGHFRISLYDLLKSIQGVSADGGNANKNKNYEVDPANEDRYHEPKGVPGTE